MSVVRSFAPGTLVGGLRTVQAPFPVAMEDGVWFAGDAVGSGFETQFPEGTLVLGTHLSLDVLVEGCQSVVFVLILQEGSSGRRFRHQYFFLNAVQARVRLPLSATDQNRWLLEREGAWLKPMVQGDRVDLAKVDRLRVLIERKSSETARFCHSPVRLHTAEPPPLEDPVLPHGPLIDALGQSALRDWPGKTRDEAEQVASLRRQRRDSASATWPTPWSEWGGCRDLRFKASGFFRVEKTDTRHWLVAPDGAAFWSAGIDCWRAGNFATPVRGLRDAFAALPPQDGTFADAWSKGRGGESVCFHTANLIRAFGADWRKAWEELACGGLRQIGFNTVANWSDGQAASRNRIPYVLPLHPTREMQTPLIFRDFPDVFDSRFEADCTELARPLAETREDAALIGYFLGNEPTWGFASQTPAEGMLACSGPCRTRDAFATWLEDRYGADLASGWQMPGASLARVREARWDAPFSDQAKADLEAFSTVMVARLYDTASKACRTVDPNHLNLGARYYTVPPPWALAGMTSFDVFSINCYRQEVPEDLGERIAKPTGRPVMVGEWHFGALDVGLPSSGIGHVPTQADRGKAFRRYTERAAALPWCVGVHYFTYYDQSAAGRFDGENYNIGFFDVCNRPYAELVDAARLSHERLYDVAQGKTAPYDDAPTYLPLLFC